MLLHTVEGGFFCCPCLVSDPLLESIRSAPEFQRLTGEARQRQSSSKPSSSSFFRTDWTAASVVRVSEGNLGYRASIRLETRLAVRSMRFLMVTALSARLT